MKCPKCQTENLADSAFCEECSAPRNGRFTRVEFFEIDALDTALARFQELGAAEEAEETA